MKNKLIALTCSIIMIITCFPVNVFAVDDSDIYITGELGKKITWSLNKDTGELVISGIGKMYDYTRISSTSSLNKVYSPLNEYKSLIKNVVIEEGITSIGDGTFYHCENLGKITIPEGVTSIGYDAFAGCSSLSEIVMPKSLTSIDGYAFIGCNGLKEITIPEKVVSIGDGAFYYCRALAEIELSESLVSIGNDVFSGCSLKEIVIPKNVISIGDYAFGSTGIQKFSVSKDNKKYMSDEWGVMYTKDKSTLICYPAKSSFSSYKVSDSTTNIIKYAFCGCNNLNEIILPESLISIGDYAFGSCSSLKEITIPKNVENIGEYAFGNTGIQKFSVVEDNKNYMSDEYGALYTNDENTLVFYPVKSELTNYNISNKTTIIGKYAFRFCRTLKEITIPESIVNIENEAFEGCKALTEITISECTNTIGSFAFAECESLKEITIPKSVKSIGTGAFWGCVDLIKITISDGVESIGDSAFLQCESLEEITIPKSVKNIGSEAFWNCRNLRKITISEGVKNIGNEAFSECKSLEEITIPESVTSIGNNAFGRYTSEILVSHSDKYYITTFDDISFDADEYYIGIYDVSGKQICIRDAVVSDGKATIILNSADYAKMNEAKLFQVKSGSMNPVGEAVLSSAKAA